ncbi:MAG: hypothetical protein IKD91_02430 [Clostridiales bacterium]|nr:hypothetical protein [Clostridiales bacterium]
MNNTEIKQIEKRCEQATKGPWISFVEGRDHTCGCNFIRTAGNDIELTGASIDDQDFIAHARQDVPALIEEIYRLKKIMDDNSIPY